MNATLAKLNRLTIDPGASSDGALLDAFLAGDQGAFAALVHRHAGLVFATCRRVLRHRQDAEDAFQATFLVLARRAADVWPRDAVGAWLFGVANRVALKARAVQSRRLVREHPLEDIASTKPVPPDFDLADAVHRVVAKLPEVYRAAIVACDLQGLSRKEAAERLGWSEGTLSGRLARARDLLATRLRRLGFALPAASGVAYFATTESVSAAFVQSTINLATGTAVTSVSAPVAALTEGVVSSMALFKLKAMVAVVFTACALGYGAFAATGAGDGDRPGAQPAQLPTAPVTPVAPPAKPASDLDPLQGSWQVAGIDEELGDKKVAPAGYTFVPPEPKDVWVVEIRGGTLKMPYKDTTGGWKRREYKIAVDATKTPKTIDLTDGSNPVSRGIYEFSAPSATCASCHTDQVAGKKVPLLNVHGMCDPGLKTARSTNLSLRLALSVDGKRPTKFGGEGVIVFDLVRAVKPSPSQTRWARDLTVWEKFDGTEDNLQLLLADIEQKARTKRLDPQSAEQLRIQVEGVLWMLRDSRKDSGVDAPSDPPARAALNLVRAKQKVEEAEALLERAEVDSERAKAILDSAKREFALAQKAGADLKKLPAAPAKDGAAFTVHVRTLTAAEKVIRVKATGKETVLEGLVHAADDIPIMTGTVSVWVVRGKEVLPVDLTAITKNGDAKTNYALKAGDQLFVQVKAAK